MSVFLGRYVCKQANYISKPEEPSKSYQALIGNKHTNAGTGMEASFRTSLFDICKRDYCAQEVAAINMKFRGVASSDTFVKLYWCGDFREALPAGPGIIDTKLNHRDLYLNRRRIWDAQTLRERNICSNRSDELSITGKHILSLSFLDFFKYYQVEFNPSSKKNQDNNARYTITKVRIPADRIPVPVPDLPVKLRSVSEADHEKYCEFRLFTLKPFLDEDDWENFKEHWTQESMKFHALHNASYRPYHLAYEDFMHHEVLKLANDGANISRLHRIIKVDGDTPSQEVSAESLDDDDDHGNKDLEKGELEPWMQLPKSHEQGVSAEELGLVITDVDQKDRDATFDSYSDVEDDLSSNWIERMAMGDGEVSREAKSNPIALEELNPEQRFVVDMLLEHHRLTDEAVKAGKVPPRPLRLIVYGLGGTGKSHVLRAFKEALDRLADNECDEESDSGEATIPKRSDDLVCVSAPSAIAAAAVGGETNHRTFSFPVSSDGKRKFHAEQIQLNQDSDGLDSLQRRHADYRYYFIDEFGMLGAQGLGIIDSRLKQAHVMSNTDSLPLGGKNVIFFGHHAQLPPVSDIRLFRERLQTPKKVTTLEVQHLHLLVDIS